MNAPQQQTLKPAARASRMTLTSVIRGKQEAPIRTVLYGPEGIGKSTFGAGAPSPIFLGAESGTDQLDVARFPKPESLADAFEAIRTLYEEQHDFGTLVVDTLDWLEPLIWKHLCQKDGVATIDEVGGGYGKGYTAAVDQWRLFLSGLERLQAAKKMHVILLAHSHIKTFKDPESEGFDRYQMKLNDKAAGVVKEWADAVLFAKYEVLSHTDKKTKRVRGVDTGARLIFTTHRAAFDAKNRYSLPESLPLSWADFYAGVRAGQVADPSTLRAEIERKAEQLGEDVRKLVLETVKKAGDNAQQLALINNRVNARLAELQTNDETASAEKGN